MDRAGAAIQLKELRKRNEQAVKGAISSLKEHSYIILELDDEELQIVSEAFGVCQTYFNGDDKCKKEYRVSSKVGYKKTKPKERYQFRRSGKNYLMPTNPPNFKEAMFAVYYFFEEIALLCLEEICKSANVPFRELMDKYGDPSPMPMDAFSTSVFNVYHYFNTESSADSCNCIPHVDPGLVTVLAKATTPGLELQHPITETWTIIENYIQDNHIILLPGETLQRLTDNQFKGNLHRVGKASRDRINLTYEMRPKHPIYYPWHQLDKNSDTQPNKEQDYDY